MHLANNQGGAAARSFIGQSDVAPAYYGITTSPRRAGRRTEKGFEPLCSRGEGTKAPASQTGGRFRFLDAHRVLV